MSKSVDYDQVAPKYGQRYAEHEFAGIERMLDALVAAGQPVLEVGCGTGHWLRHLRARGCAVVGLDPSRGMLERALQAGGAAGALVRGRAEALPFVDGAFDRVVVINALHHFAEPARFAAEARRVLARAGQIAVVGLDPTQGVDEWFVYRYFPRTRQLDLERFPTTGRIRAWLEAAGFRDCAQTVAERIDLTMPAREYLDRGLLTRESTSQLTLLDDAEFARGVANVEAAIDEARAAGEPLLLRAQLCLWAVTGRAG